MESRIVPLNNNIPFSNLLAVILSFLKKDYLCKIIDKDDTRTIFEFKKTNNEDFKFDYTCLGINSMRTTLKIRNNQFSLYQRLEYKFTKIILENNMNFKSENKDRILISSENDYNLDQIFFRYKFFEDNYKIIIPFINNIKECNKTNYKDFQYSTNTFYKYAKITNLIDNDLTLIRQVVRKKYLNFISFLEKFQKENNKTIQKVLLKNIAVYRNNSKISIYCGKDLLFENDNLNINKYIIHPGICLALHMIGNEELIKYKYYKQKLLSI